MAEILCSSFPFLSAAPADSRTVTGATENLHDHYVRHCLTKCDRMVALESRVRIDHLVWDDWNRNHIARHGVTPEDVEEVVAGAPVARESYKGRFLLLGPNLLQRILAVVIGPVPEQHNVYYVFSARPASRRERRFYQQQQGDVSP